MTIKTKLFRAAVAAAMAANLPAATAADLEEALTGGTATLNLRLRYEFVEQENPAEDGHGFTARPRLGYRTGTWHGFDGVAEFEGTYALGGDDEYNSGPPFLEATNGNTGYSTIADPTGEEINRAWLRYRGPGATTVKAGRQRIILDNARFVGNIGWRDNEQTFDALRLTNEALPGVTLNYAYVWAQNFIFFNDNEMDGHLINANLALSEALEVAAYAYLIDYQDDASPRAPSAPDHRVIGLRASGGLGPVAYALEYADQSDYADAADTVDAEYAAAKLSLPGLPIKPILGYEILGGDGTYAFQFPLATNHAFQGWADVFLTTPPDGVVDTYAGLATTAAHVTFKAFYHDFGADNGNSDYGSELNLAAVFSATDHLTLLTKFADYDADQFAVDTRRYWLQAVFSF